MKAYKGHLEMARPQQTVLVEDMIAQIDKRRENVTKESNYRSRNKKTNTSDT